MGYDGGKIQNSYNTGKISNSASSDYAFIGGVCGGGSIL